MYLVTAYFDEKTEKDLRKHIENIANLTGNQFMIDNHVPPHMTILGLESPSADGLKNVFEDNTLKCGCIDIVISSVGQLFPYVMYVQPILNEQLLSLHGKMLDTFESHEDVKILKYYRKDLWMPHITVGKTLNESQMKKAFEYMLKHFSMIEGKVVKLGLSKTNPHEDLLIKDLL